MLAAGASVVLPAAWRFSAATFWSDAQAYGVTYYTAVPTIHQVGTSNQLLPHLCDHTGQLFIISEQVSRCMAEHA